ncbi:hypothetical protein TNIN_425771 [Trichonephila inaurata madagascariensis]|uniref:Uncharacterized protein n=1 Tax=Trichonephila inaurata madagascariensis TaxID=2747483 RepID=A0A8X6YMJ1_9ARAC|nr:hypothetical protein TNIN_425771 [Trichonephila inaurata madagascariensis]
MLNFNRESCIKEVLLFKVQKTYVLRIEHFVGCKRYVVNQWRTQCCEVWKKLKRNWLLGKLPVISEHIVDSTRVKDVISAFRETFTQSANSVKSQPYVTRVIDVSYLVLPKRIKKTLVYISLIKLTVLVSCPTFEKYFSCRYLHRWKSSPLDKDHSVNGRGPLLIK